MRAAHVAAAATAALLFASIASAQGLGDVAAREKEKRKTEKAEGKDTGKVFTESDLGPSLAPASLPQDLPTEEEAKAATDPAAAEEGEGTEGAPADGTSEAAQVDEKARAEEAWHKKLDLAHKEAAVYQEVIDKLQLELNDTSGGIYNPGRAAKINFLEENKQLLAQTQQKIASLEEEGRSNGYH
jgi:hypothetical protein